MIRFQISKLVLIDYDKLAAKDSTGQESFQEDLEKDLTVQCYSNFDSLKFVCLQEIEKLMQPGNPGPTALEEKKQAHKDHAPLLVAKADLSGTVQQQIDEILAKSFDLAAGEADSDILAAQAKVDALISN